MTNALLIAILALLVFAVVLQVLLLLKKVDFGSLHELLQGLDKSYERTERTVREEIGKNRDEAGAAARESRKELGDTLSTMGNNLNQQIVALTNSSDLKLERMRETVEQRLQLIQAENGRKLEE